MTDYRAAADDRFIQWIRLACPKCGVGVEVLAGMPSLVAWCTRCPGRPMLRTAP